MGADPVNGSTPTWIERCAKRWVLFTACVLGLSGTIAAGPTIAEYLRPWATRGEVKLVADRVYPNAIKDQRLTMTRIQRRIEWLEGQNILNQTQQQELQDLYEDRIDADEDLTKLIRERARFRLSPTNEK